MSANRNNPITASIAASDVERMDVGMVSVKYPVHNVWAEKENTLKKKLDEVLLIPDKPAVSVTI